MKNCHKKQISSNLYGHHFCWWNLKVLNKQRKSCVKLSRGFTIDYQLKCLFFVFEENSAAKSTRICQSTLHTSFLVTYNAIMWRRVRSKAITCSYRSMEILCLDGTGATRSGFLNAIEILSPKLMALVSAKILRKSVKIQDMLCCSLLKWALQRTYSTVANAHAQCTCPLNFKHHVHRRRKDFFRGEIVFQRWNNKLFPRGGNFYNT